MIVHFIEATNNFNWGKFMLARLDDDEKKLKSALPGFEHESLIYGGGVRALNDDTTLVLDLQTGEGACFTLDMAGPAHEAVLCAKYALDKHAIWVCPMYEPFLAWLHQQGLGRGQGDITKLPRCVELEAHGAFAGYRRGGGVDLSQSDDVRERRGAH